MDTTRERQGAVTEKLVYKAYKFRMYPKPEQVAYFRRVFGCCRLVYNHFLQVRIDAYEARKLDPSVRVPSRFDMCKLLTDFKRERTSADGHAFLKDVDSTALVYEIQHLDDAFLHFFRRVKEGGSDAGFPRFKRRGDKDSATMAFKKASDVRADRVRFAKIGWVKANCWREIEGEPMRCTVSLDAAGRWWASIVCRDVPQVWPEPTREVGVIRLQEAASEQSDADAAKVRRLKKRLAREKRRLARRQAPGPNRKASARYLKQKERVGRLEAQTADARHTQAGQLTAPLVRECATIVVEGARTAGADGSGEGRKLTPTENELLRQLRYKCDWAGRELIER